MTRKPLRRKPKQARSGETLEVIIEAAAHVLLEYGYAKATTNRIAERAGVSVGSLYQYFDSKDAVFVAVMQNYISQLAKAVRETPLPKSATIMEKLELITIAGIQARPDGPRLLFLLSYTNSTEFREILDRGKSEVTNFVGNLVEAETQSDRATLDLRLQLAMDAIEGSLFNAASKLEVELYAKELSRLIGPYLLNDFCAPEG